MARLPGQEDGAPAWRAAGLPALRPVESTDTVGLGALAAMVAQARGSEHRILKVKCDAVRNVEVVAAIRHARPDAEIAIDANESWSFEQLGAIAPELARLGVVLIEQPVAAEADEVLRGWRSPVPLAADEAFRDRRDLHRVAGKYRYVNIKLDKCGGLTEGFACAAAIREAGMRPMVGCMGGSSLGNAPAFLLAQLCDFVDLDSSIPLVEPWADPIRFERGWAQPPSPSLWG